MGHFHLQSKLFSTVKARPDVPAFFCENARRRYTPRHGSHRAAVEKLGVENVRRLLAYAPGAVVPGIGDGMALRGDVQDWLFEQEGRTARAPRRRDFWQRVGIAVGATGIGVSALVGWLLR
jgi:hypothetical protein